MTGSTDQLCPFDLFRASFIITNGLVWKIRALGSCPHPSKRRIQRFRQQSRTFILQTLSLLPPPIRYGVIRNCVRYNPDSIFVVLRQFASRRLNGYCIIQHKRTLILGQPKNRFAYDNPCID